MMASNGQENNPPFHAVAPRWLRRLPFGTSRFGAASYERSRSLTRVAFARNTRLGVVEYEIAFDDPVTLLSINGASEVLVSYFPARTPRSDEHHIPMVWFSSTLLLVVSTKLFAGDSATLFPDLLYVCDVYMSFNTATTASAISVYRRTDNPFETSAPTPETSAPLSLTHHLDVLVQLLAKHESIELLNFQSRQEHFERVLPDQFPLSNAGLEAMLAGCSRRPFKLSFYNLLPLIEQWRCLAFHCPKHVQLHVYDDEPEALQEVVEALRCNGGRLARLMLTFHNPIPDSVSESMEITPSLKQLYIQLRILRPCQDSLGRFFQGLQRNNGLLRLCLDAKLERINKDNRFLLWSALGSHPTLRSFSFANSRNINISTGMELEPDVTEALLGAVRSNHNLCDLELDGSGRTLSRHAQQKLAILLSYNRFGQQVRTIQQESDPIVRERAMCSLLLSGSVRVNLDKLYLLLKVNPNWFPVRRGSKRKRCCEES